MLYRLLADGLVLVHFGFVLFVVLGGLLVLRWPRLVWLHLPAAAWGFAIEVFGWLCPLTSFENDLRRRAGLAGYEGGFIEHYILPVLYPPGLTRETQWLLAAIVLLINAVVYTIFWRRRARKPSGVAGPS